MCIISKPWVNSNWSWSPETLNSGQNRQLFLPCDLEIWRMPFKNIRVRLLCHWGTVILSDQFPVLWHQAVAAHHWTGRSLPRGTSVAMSTTMPSNLCRSQAVMTGLIIQCLWTDLTHLRQGCHCELSSVELHPYEREVLARFKVGLLVVDDPA